MSLVPIVVDKQENVVRQMDIFSRLLKDRIIMLVGEIDQTMSNLIIAQLLHLESENHDSDIYMYINSQGGSVIAALAIYDVMKYISPKVITVCMGEACSAASLLFCSGERRLLMKHARILLHQPMGGTRGQAADLDIYVKEIMTLQDQLLEIYHVNTGIDKQKLKNFFDRDTIFRGEETITLGLADEIVQNKISKRGHNLLIEQPKGKRGTKK